MASCSIIQRIELCGSGHSCHWHHCCPQAGTSKTAGRRGDPHVGPPQGLPCTPSMAPAAPALGAGVHLSPSVSSQMDTHPEGTDRRREPIPDPGSTHSRHPWVMHGRIMVIIVRQDYSGTFRQGGGCTAPPSHCWHPSAHMGKRTQVGMDGRTQVGDTHRPGCANPPVPGLPCAITVAMPAPIPGTQHPSPRDMGVLPHPCPMCAAPARDGTPAPRALIAMAGAGSVRAAPVN